MTYLYLFNEGSKAALYGIGTYIQQLINCLQDEREISFNIVQLHSKEKEYKQEKVDTYNAYYFPSVPVSSWKDMTRYCRNIWHLLVQQIKISESDQLIFHLNYYQEYPFVDLMKEVFPSCTVLFSVHYQNWCFFLNGNTTHLKYLLSADDTLIKTEEEELALISYAEEKKLLQKVDYIICLSAYTKKLLIEDYVIPEDKMTLIYNGLKSEMRIFSKEEKKQLKRQLFISEDTKIILFVGRLDKIKGVDKLIDAFKETVSIYPDCHLYIVGEGDKMPVYIDMTKGCQDKITFTGRLEKKDLYTFYQIADLGVLPSMHEQCSFVAIEVMSFGIPLIGTSTTGLKEMILQYKGGRIIEMIESERNISVSIDEISKCILYVLKQKEHIQYEKPQQFDLDLMKKNYLNTYAKCSNRLI